MLLALKRLCPQMPRDIRLLLVQHLFVAEDSMAMMRRDEVRFTPD